MSESTERASFAVLQLPLSGQAEARLEISTPGARPLTLGEETLLRLLWEEIDECLVCKRDWSSITAEIQQLAQDRAPKVAS